MSGIRHAGHALWNAAHAHTPIAATIISHSTGVARSFAGSDAMLIV